MRVGVCIRAYVRAHVRAYVFMYMCAHMHAYLCESACICAYICICIYICVYTCVRACMFVCACALCTLKKKSFDSHKQPKLADRVEPKGKAKNKKGQKGRKDHRCETFKQQFSCVGLLC